LFPFLKLDFSFNNSLILNYTAIFFFACKNGCMLSINFVKISNSIYRRVNISENGSISRFIDSAILGVWPIALRLFIVHVIINVILHMEYGAVRVKWHHFWIQRTMLIYLKSSLALVWSTVIDIYILAFNFQPRNSLAKYSVYMKFWDTQTLWLLL